MKKFLAKYLLTLVILILIISGYSKIGKTEEVVKVSGSKMQYFYSEDRLDIIGQAKVLTEDVTIYAEKIEAVFKNGEVIEIKAYGNVKVEKKEDTYTGAELTYHLKSKTGLILEIQSQAKLEDSEEIAYLSGDKANYSDDLIEIFDGHFTTCDLEHPHYLFKARKIKVYPGEKIKAYHVTFWEFNGKIPLFYWPYYSKSLKEEKNKFTPSIGYSAVTGWFLKTTYSFFNENSTHGELYGDYYQKLGLGGGLRYYYMDDDRGQGYTYIYLQQKKENLTSPYLTLEHSQSYKWNDWQIKSSSTIKRYLSQDTLSNTSVINYMKGRNSFNWNGTYSGSINNLTGNQNHKLVNKLKTGYELFGVNVSGSLTDERFINRPDFNYWEGHLKLWQSKSFINWYLLTKKTANRNKDFNFYTLPEFEVKLDFGRLKAKKINPFISPFDYTLKAGHYIENRTKTDALKLFNRLDFTKSFKIIGPLSLKTTASTSFNVYSTGDYNYTYTPGVELIVRDRSGFYSNLKYIYENGAGQSPFAFDAFKVYEKQSVSGSIGYQKKGLRLNSTTTYNLITRKFTTMINSVNYNSSNAIFRLSIPFNIQDKKFTKITTYASLKFTDLQLNLDAEFEPQNFAFKKIKSKLDWQVNQDWHINFETQFDPSSGFNLDDYKTKAFINITKNLHCREISVNYDFVAREIWFNYSITAFPKEKVRVGSNPEEPILLDMNLGGVSIGK